MARTLTSLTAMDAARQSARAGRPWDDELRALLPDGADIFDAHLHLGHDIDGMVGDYDQLEQLMARYGISRAFMFCLDEPDRHPGVHAPRTTARSRSPRARTAG